MNVSKKASQFLAVAVSLAMGFPGGALAATARGPMAISSIPPLRTASPGLQRPSAQGLAPASALPGLHAPRAMAASGGAQAVSGQLFDAVSAIAAAESREDDATLLLSGIGTLLFDGANDRDGSRADGGGFSGGGEDYPEQAPILSRTKPLFPHNGMRITIPLTDAKAAHYTAIAAKAGGYVMVVAALPNGDNTKLKNAEIGTLSRITLTTKGSDLQVDIDGLREARVERYVDAGVAALSYPEIHRAEGFEAAIVQEIGFALEAGKKQDMLFAQLDKTLDLNLGSDAVANRLLTMLMVITPQAKQALLKTLSIPARLDAVLQILKLLAKNHAAAAPAAAADASETPKEEEGAEDDALNVLREKFARIGDAMTPEANAAVKRELGRLKRINPQSPEYSVALDYLTVLLEMPWNASSQDSGDLDAAQRILDADHYGLEKVKERIVEYLAIRKATGNKRGLILAFDGPPGVGKTSLGKSIARALGRKLGRVSLGGVRDEAELRGHRRTYVGAQPGRIVKELRKLGVNNPVLQLDEIDKLGTGGGGQQRGDPEAALLEILDPAQNSTFRDHYLDVEFDLSNVLFIATSNELANISGPLRDRLDVIRIAGYTEKEKIAIARAHLIKRQLEDNGFKPDEIAFTASALSGVIAGYTAESGVRQLERAIGAILRRLKTRLMRGVGETTGVVEPAHLKDLMGAAPREKNKDLANGVGVASGLYWSQIGGGVLLIETKALPKGTGSRGQFTVTGSIKEVMTESAELARQNATEWALKQGVDPRVFATHDFALHVPDGATPKDGPSAGITMFTALASRYTGRAVRQGVAMTGELTQSGLVWPIGGLKEKAIGALELGYTEIIISEKNRGLYEELPEEVRQKIKFHFVKTADEVAEIALEKTGEPMTAFQAAQAAPSGIWARVLAAVRAFVG